MRVIMIYCFLLLSVTSEAQVDSGAKANVFDGILKYTQISENGNKRLVEKSSDGLSKSSRLYVKGKLKQIVQHTYNHNGDMILYVYNPMKANSDGKIEQIDYQYNSEDIIEKQVSIINSADTIVYELDRIVSDSSFWYRETRAGVERKLKFTFNSDGRLIERRTPVTNNSMAIEVFSYYDNGLIDEVQWLDGNGEVLKHDKREYEYYKNGRLKQSWIIVDGNRQLLSRYKY